MNGVIFSLARADMIGADLCQCSLPRIANELQQDTCRAALPSEAPMSYIADCGYQAAGFRNGSRSTRRRFVRMPATITTPIKTNRAHTAFVRDISPCGMFFYSNLQLEEGTRVDFVLEYADKFFAKRLHLSGVVKRVEGDRPGAAVGIAIEFDHRYDEVPCRRPIA
jgi:hypothetical protein